MHLISTTHIARRLAIILAIVIGLVLSLVVSEREGNAQWAKFERDGQLTKPEGYREWIYVGTPVTPNELNMGKAAFPEFHNVYIHPEAYEAYKKTGKFANGTILVKELVAVGAKKASSGNGYFMGDYVGLEATVKDSTRFREEPGNWAYFSFGKRPNLAASTKAMPTMACNTCHETTAAEDWVFTQFYPVLRAARPR